MPLLFSKRISNVLSYAIWKISETYSELKEIHSDPPPDFSNSKKKSEWLATRILVKLLCQKFYIAYRGIKKNNNGKPFLKNSNAQISISHSYPFGAAMINLDKTCGVDLEYPRKQLNTVKHKFLNDMELIYQNDTTALCKIWASKEAVYKKLGIKHLNFKEDIQLSLGDNAAIATIIKNNEKTMVYLSIDKVNDYFLVYSK